MCQAYDLYHEIADDPLEILCRSEKNKLVEVFALRLEIKLLFACKRHADKSYFFQEFARLKGHVLSWRNKAWALTQFREEQKVFNECKKRVDKALE